MTTIPTEYLVRVRCAPGSDLPKGSVTTWMQTGNREQAQQAADDYAATQRRIGRQVTDVMVSRDVATFPDGAYVRIVKDIDIWPLGIFRAGLTGEVTENGLTDDDDQPIAIELDEQFEALNEWNNALQVWLDGTDQSVCTMDCFEVITTRAALGNRMRSLGYETMNTGGGCMVWCKEDEATKTQLWLCTEGNEVYGNPEAPTWIIGRYLTDSIGWSNCTGLTLEQALAFIDAMPVPGADDEIMLHGMDDLRKAI